MASNLLLKMVKNYDNNELESCTPSGWLERQPRLETRDRENAFRNIAHFYWIVIVIVIVVVSL